MKYKSVMVTINDVEYSVEHLESLPYNPDGSSGIASGVFIDVTGLHKARMKHSIPRLTYQRNEAKKAELFILTVGDFRIC